jgi:ribonuclease HI
MISIFTDASCNTTSKNCGYAFYIGGRGIKIQRAGVLKVKTNNSTIAEVHCIANALHVLVNNVPKKFQRVTIYSDCKYFIQAINGDNRGFRDTELQDVLQEIRFLCMEYCIAQDISIRKYLEAFSFVHIKAHTRKGDKPTLINAWCDRTAVYCRKFADKKPIYVNKELIINYNII